MTKERIEEPQVVEGFSTAYPENGCVCILSPTGRKLRFTSKNARLLAEELLSCAEEVEYDVQMRQENGNPCTLEEGNEIGKDYPERP